MGPAMGQMGPMGPMDERKRRLMQQMQEQGAMAPPGFGAAGHPGLFKPPGQGGMMGAAMGAMPGGPPPGGPPPGGIPQPQMMAPPPNIGVPGQTPGQLPQQPGMHGVSQAGPVPIADTIRQNYQNQMKQQLAASQTPANPGMVGSAGLVGLGLGAGTGSPIAAGVGAGVGALGQYMKDRRKRVPTTTAFAQGGVVRMAAGGAAKERKNFPNTTPPKKGGKRGMGAATRGAGKAQG